MQMCHDGLRQGRSPGSTADVLLTYTEQALKCALKSLAGRRVCLWPGCELHSPYFDPRSDDTDSFVKLCVENA